PRRGPREGRRRARASSDLLPLPNGADHALDRLVDGDAVLLPAVAVPEGHRARGDVLSPGDEHERHLLRRGVADLLAEAVVGDVDLGADATGTQTVDDVLQVLHEGLGDRD